MNTRIRIVNMTSTEIYKTLVETTMAKIRHENTGVSDVAFEPAHLSGIFGQREILENSGVMRQVQVSS